MLSTIYYFYHQAYFFALQEHEQKQHNQKFCYDTMKTINKEEKNPKMIENERTESISYWLTKYYAF